MARKIVSVCLFLFFVYPALAIEFYQAKEGTAAYEKPSENSPVIYRFKPGEEFKVIDKEKGEWLKVRFSNQVSGSDTSRTQKTLIFRAKECSRCCGPRQPGPSIR